MAERDLSSAVTSDLTNAVTDFSVDPVTTDAAGEQKETEWINTEWSNQLGYYKKIPELKISVDALARWTIGKGYTTNEITWMSLFQIRGFGKDTFNSILENQTKVSKIGGDSYAEIIRQPLLKRIIKRITGGGGLMVNLKPLDPGVMKIVANRQGIIIRYEQVTKGTTPNKKFKPEEIFHLCRNRTADEIHGESIVIAVEEIILARNEAMKDMRELMHRYVRPRFFFHLDTDDDTEIAKFKATCDNATEGGENVYIPKGAVVPELLSVPTNSTLNPLPWINTLNQYFFQATGVPQIIVGGAQEITEASAKIAYLAFEQTIEGEQLYIEEQVLAQLHLEIELEFPASLENELLSDKAKSETMQASTPEDTNVQDVGVQ